MRKMVLCLLVILLCFGAAFAALNNDDYNGLQVLKNQWQHLPPSWSNTSDDDACRKWVGITCKKSRVTEIKLSTMGINGTLMDDIGQFTELKVLDLSQNKGLGGPIPQDIGKLINLTRLILSGCSFNGTIPDTIGNLINLKFLDLNSNQLYGKIPPSLGRLSEMFWFDLSNNFLSGPLPVSNGTEPGLDQLLEAAHFHFNKNQLSGSIPESLFSSNMKLVHVLFDGNRLSGSIPAALGLVPTLQVLRLDRNFLEGPVPSTLNNLSKLYELNLADNKLSGPLPNLTGMSKLQFVNLSNNAFDPSESPAWFTNLQSLQTLIIATGKVQGDVPPALFNLSAIQEIIFDDNWFGGSLNIPSISTSLKHVSLRRNNITGVSLNLDFNVSLMLSGNPFCNRTDNVSPFKSQICNLTEKPPEPYSTDLSKCNVGPCPPDQLPNPQGGCSCPFNDQSLHPRDCTCAYPYEGILYFRAPIFHEMPNSSFFKNLEMKLATPLNVTTYIYKPFLNNDTYLQVGLKLFPSGQMRFNRSKVSQIGFDLNNHSNPLPTELGPYNFYAAPYMYFTNDEVIPISGGSSKKIGLIIGLSVAFPLLVALIAVSLYAFKQKKRAKKAKELSGTFVNSGAQTPKVKGARWFSYGELKKITNDFAQNNEIGSGGYGKVYRGMLASGQLLAIKRAHQGSMQRSNEFNTEIELLSRVHHKNLATLVGFCFDQGEQMLVYEFIPNGSLRDSLSGKSGVHLDWRRRLRVALGSARGLAYLHELADPPIIHRDVKSANILLDENLSAKVSDFGLSKLISDSGRGAISSQVKGTLGYLDPEYYMTQQLTAKSDVYGFGVVMLELITGRPPLERGRYVVRDVRAMVNRTDEQHWGLSGIIDRRILISANNPLVAFTKFVQLALRCSEDEAVNRPTMNEVVKEIESMLQSNDATNSDPTNYSSSANSETGFRAKGNVIRHPYMDSFGSRDNTGSSSLEFSGGYLVSTRVEPK